VLHTELDSSHVWAFFVCRLRSFTVLGTKVAYFSLTNVGSGFHCQLFFSFQFYVHRGSIRGIFVSGVPRTSILCQGCHEPQQNLNRIFIINRVGQNHIYTVHVRYFWQGNHQIYGHIRCIYTVLANPNNKQEGLVMPRVPCNKICHATSFLQQSVPRTSTEPQQNFIKNEKRDKSCHEFPPTKKPGGTIGWDSGG
jgi:hypothetical protein